MKLEIYKNVDLLISEEDRAQLDEMLKEYPPEIAFTLLSSTISTDKKGRIVSFQPTGQIRWNLVFYIQNLMIRQRLFEMDRFVDRMEGNND